MMGAPLHKTGRTKSSQSSHIFHTFAKIIKLDFMAVIALEGMEFFSYHGHFEEESVIGTKFIIDLFLETDTTKAEESDELEDTVNYQEVYLTIKEQMTESSKLIETVARRTLNTIMEKFPEIETATLKLRKINPPLGGLLESVSINLSST